MKKATNIILVHLAIQLVFCIAMLLVFVQEPDNAYRGLGYMIMQSLGLLVHIGLGLLIALVIRLSKLPEDQRKELIKGHLLGVLFALLLGAHCVLLRRRFWLSNSHYAAPRVRVDWFW
jgi:hypothetical protein